MSAKDANPAGEVGKANNKDGDLIESPNITHASADESEPYIDAKEEARKAERKEREKQNKERAAQRKAEREAAKAAREAEKKK